jgi:hypothetical protein
VGENLSSTNTFFEHQIFSPCFCSQTNFFVSEEKTSFCLPGLISKEEASFCSIRAGRVPFTRSEQIRKRKKFGVQKILKTFFVFQKTKKVKEKIC